MLQDNDDGTVWVGFAETGAICAMRTGQAQCYGSETFGQGVLGLYEDRNRKLWVAAANGLWMWAPGPPQRYTYPAGVSYANGLAEDDNGVLLLATPDGLKQLAGDKIQSYPLAGIARDIRPNYLFRSTDGSLWIGTRTGLLHLHNGRVDQILRQGWTFRRFHPGHYGGRRR